MHNNDNQNNSKIAASRQRCIRHITVYLLFALIVAVVSPLIGSEQLDFGKIAADFRSDAPRSIDSDILFGLRIPRLLLAFLTGGSLAIVGCTFQVILRNPLATPYTLGVTAGAATGAYIAIAFPAIAFSWGPFSSIQILALAGAALILLLIYLIARKPGGIAMNTLLLAGVTIGILCGALILLIRYISNPNLLVAMDRWIMGSVDTVGYLELAAVIPLLLPGVGLLALQTHSFNHLALGREMAAGYGVDVARVHRHSFFAGSLATAAVISVTGPIGFVGLLIPHAVRKLSGYDHRIVLPASFLLGGGFLVACDTIARTIVAPTEMPVGIITALLGGPFFIYLLLRQK